MICSSSLNKSRNHGSKPVTSEKCELILVHLSGHLKDFTGRKRVIEIPSSSVESVIALVQYLNQLFPGIKDRIFDEQDHTRTYVNIFVNGEDIRSGDHEITTLKEGDKVHILPSVAGG